MLRPVPAAASGSGAGPTVGLVPPREPAANALPPPGQRAGFAPVDYGRSREGIGPLRLPGNFTRLSPPEQMLVVIDLERVNRGLAPIAGLSGPLDAAAARGLADHGDPVGPSGYSWGSVWAVGSGLADTDWAWMYDDGPGGENLDCPRVGAPGCWVHRRIILQASDGASLVAGVAGGGEAFAALIVRGYPSAHLAFSWASELRWFSAPPGPEADLPGYDVVSSAGGVGALGGRWCGSARAAGAGRSVAITATSTGQGYIVVRQGGTVAACGDARSYGSVPLRPGATAAGIAYDPVTGGYWVVSSDGGVYNEDAPFLGSPFSERRAPPPSPVRGVAVTPDGRGYLLVEADGDVDAFGDARFHGSAPLRPGATAAGIAYDPVTGGYWVVSSDGGVYNEDAPFLGSDHLAVLADPSDPVTGVAASPGGGYVLLRADGDVNAFGDAGFAGSVSSPTGVTAVGITWR
jgi:hypothetical protein